MRRLKVLVTGANGFLGSHLVKSLRQHAYEVYTTDLWGSNLNYLGDLQDPVFLKKIFETTNFDIVVHAAALVPLVDDRKGFKEINGLVSGRLARLAKENEVKQFVLVSSSAPYGRPVDFPITDQTPLIPIESYGESKIMAEEEVTANLSGNVSLAVIRPRTILGGDRFGIFEILFRWITNGYAIPMPGGANHYLQLVHVDDLCRLIIHLIEKELDGIWPAGAQNYRTLKEDLQTACEQNGLSIDILNVPSPIFKSLASLARILRISPFTPWHYSTLDTNFAFSKEWKPNGFEYEFSNVDCLSEALASYRANPHSTGESAHTRNWSTKAIDFALKGITGVRKQN